MVTACHIIISKKYDREERVLGGWEKGWGRKDRRVGTKEKREERRIKKEREEEKYKKAENYSSPFLLHIDTVIQC